MHPGFVSMPFFFIYIGNFLFQNLPLSTFDNEIHDYEKLLSMSGDTIHKLTIDLLFNRGKEKVTNTTLYHCPLNTGTWGMDGSNHPLFLKSH